ncbi:MAG: hypothetical protein U1E30_08745 [Rhodoblastus sp.]
MQIGRKLTATAGLLGAALCLPLAGCVDTAGQARLEPAAAPSKIARRPGVSPRGATVALASVAGAPQDVNDRFALAFAQSAGGQDLTTVEPAKAEYLVRAYIDAGAAEPGVTRISYVVDLFDRSKRRVARLTDEMPVKGAAADPWTAADDSVLSALAARTASDLADALTNTPEAAAGAAVASNASSATSRSRGAQAGSSTAARQEREPESARVGLAATR